ncbi:MAG: hypothetical protein V4598_02695 [Bdellovibrionota bacterium]
MKKPVLLTTCLLSILLGCGSDKDEFEEEKAREEEINQETQGSYETFLVPVNTETAGSTVGSFMIRIQGDEVRVRGEVENSPNTFHKQFLHTGSACPGPGADTDLDGVVSFEESLQITGPALIPLDQNLSSQTAGYVFPVARAMGAYTYFEITSLTLMMNDLHREDSVPTDALVKLSPEEDLSLVGKTIVIYGVPGNSSVPVACGTIRRKL